MHKINNLRNLMQRVLVVSSYPGDFTDDIVYAMLDLFLRDYVALHNEKVLNLI